MVSVRLLLRLLTFLCILERFFFLSLFVMNFFLGAVDSRSFFTSTSLILRLSRVRSTWSEEDEGV